MATVVREQGRAYIEGVRRIAWGADEGCGCEFAMALVSALEALGDSVPYHHVMGVTGAAFRLTVHCNPWDPGSYSARAMAPDPAAPIRRAFEAVGRAYTLCEMSSEGDDAARIKTSIDIGLPVLAHGVVGPSDCSIVTGYDEDGAVLMGWSTYQDIPFDHDEAPDATGYFRKHGWHANTRGYILLGDRVNRRPLPAVHRDALELAVHLVRQREVNGNPAGLGAYGYWADALLDDRDFPAGDAPALGGPYLGILCNLMMVDDRRAAVDFLYDAATHLPDSAVALREAASHYEETGRLRTRLTALLAEDFSEPAILSLAERELREEYASVLRAIQRCDTCAIEAIERALV